MEKIKNKWVDKKLPTFKKEGTFNIVGLLKLITNTSNGVREPW